MNIYLPPFTNIGDPLPERNLDRTFYDLFDTNEYWRELLPRIYPRRLWMPRFYDEWFIGWAEISVLKLGKRISEIQSQNGFVVFGSRSGDILDGFHNNVGQRLGTWLHFQRIITSVRRRQKYIDEWWMIIISITFFCRPKELTRSLPVEIIIVSWVIYIYSR